MEIFLLSSPRRRGPIRRSLSIAHGVWVPALPPIKSGVGRDDSANMPQTNGACLKCRKPNSAPVSIASRTGCSTSPTPSSRQSSAAMRPPPPAPSPAPRPPPGAGPTTSSRSGNCAPTGVAAARGAAAASRAPASIVICRRCRRTRATASGSCCAHAGRAALASAPAQNRSRPRQVPRRAPASPA